MRTVVALSAALLLACGGAQAFSSPAVTPSGGMRMKDVRKAVDNLTADNFADTLSSIEPYLLNEAGAALYGKSMRRIAVRAKHLGVAIPDNYAVDAQATAKRRAKQDAFIQAKIAEAAEAAESAEGEEAAVAPEEEAAAAAEETVQEEPELVAA